MRLTVGCIGRLKTGPEKSLAEEYSGRIRQMGKGVGLRQLAIVERPESQRQNVAERMEEEGTALMAALPSGVELVVLDERGSNLGSVEFARLIESHIGSGCSDLAILIGGPDGHGPGIKNKTKHIISLGSMTWPHRLVRVMILEQVYRAVTIMVNHPYHRA